MVEMPSLFFYNDFEIKKTYGVGIINE